MFTGKRLDYQAKHVAYNVYSFFKKRKMDPDSEEHIYDMDLARKVGEVTGLSPAAIEKIVQEGNLMKAEEGVVDFKPKEDNRKMANKSITYDDFTEALIRKRFVKYFLSKNELPSVRTLNKLVKEEDILQCSYEHLRELLCKLGFTNLESDSLAPLKEGADIMSERMSYLQAIKDYRSQNRPVFYHSEIKHWVHDDDTKAKPKDMPRSVMVHTSGSPGFLDQTQIMIRLNPKSNDEEFEQYEIHDWIKDLVLPNLPLKSVIVTNIPYCETVESMLQDEKPTLESSRESIEAWLNRHNILFKETATDTELVRLIHNQEINDKISITKIIKENGHEVLHLPQNHSDLNIAAVMWQDVKEEAVSSAKELFTTYSIEKWEECLNSVKESEEVYFEFGKKINKSNVTVQVKQEVDKDD